MKKIISLFCIACLTIGMVFCAPKISAAVIKKGIVEVGTVKSIVGDEVVVPVLIKENPGIMAVTISVTYDPTALEYVSHYYGNVFDDYTIANHTDRKLVRVVICGITNKRKDGTIISLKFRVTKDAKAELTPITVKYTKGDFCNWNLDKIMPEVISGGVEVAFNGENCPHKNYGEWSIVTEPSCEDVGVKVRTCSLCGHNKYKEISPIGHTYSENWTVDRPATEDSDGTMSRYCIRCDDYVDRITFSLEQSEKEDIDNIIWEDFTDKETAEEIFKEQNPGKKPTKNPTSNKNEADAKPQDSSKVETVGNTSADGTLSKPTDKPQQPSQKDEDSSSMGDVLEQILEEAENQNGEIISVYQELIEAFPRFKTIIKVAQILLIILAVIVF